MIVIGNLQITTRVYRQFFWCVYVGPLNNINNSNMTFNLYFNDICPFNFWSKIYTKLPSNAENSMMCSYSSHKFFYAIIFHCGQAKDTKEKFTLCNIFLLLLLSFMWRLFFRYMLILTLTLIPKKKSKTLMASTSKCV